jgi:hypothetical protein
MAELQTAPHVKCVEVFQPTTTEREYQMANQNQGGQQDQGNPNQGGQQGNPDQQTQKPGQGGQQGGQDNPGQQNQK